MAGASRFNSTAGVEGTIVSAPVVAGSVKTGVAVSAGVKVSTGVAVPNAGTAVPDPAG